MFLKHLRKVQSLPPEATWLAPVKRCALEYHGHCADGEKLGSVLDSLGFDVRRRDHGTRGYLEGMRRNRH
jgi:hypothetical protein